MSAATAERLTRAEIIADWAKCAAESAPELTDDVCEIIAAVLRGAP